MPLIVDRLSAFFQLFAFAHGNLSAQREVINAKVFKNAAFDVGVEGFYRKGEFRMVSKDLIKGLPFFEERGNGCLLYTSRNTEKTGELR